jgi:hypothetical protein
VGERLKTAVLKNKNADSLSKQKIQLNSLASRKIATIFLSEFVLYCPFCASFSYNFATSSSRNVMRA